MYKVAIISKLPQKKETSAFFDSIGVKYFFVCCECFKEEQESQDIDVVFYKCHGFHASNVARYEASKLAHVVVDNDIKQIKSCYNTVSKEEFFAIVELFQDIGNTYGLIVGSSIGVFNNKTLRQQASQLFLGQLCGKVFEDFWKCLPITKGGKNQDDMCQQIRASRIGIPSCSSIFLLNESKFLTTENEYDKIRFNQYKQVVLENPSVKLKLQNKHSFTLLGADFYFTVRNNLFKQSPRYVISTKK